MGLIVAIGMTGLCWPTAVAVALSAGSLAASLTGCGAKASAPALVASLVTRQVATPGWRVVATQADAAALVDGLSASGKNNA